MIENSLMVAIGGFAGAVARYSISRMFSVYWPKGMPLATWFVNIAGSFLLGWIAASGLQDIYVLLLGTGFMGAFTTFSTFKMDSIELLRAGKAGLAVAYIASMYTVGVAAVFAGYAVGSGGL